MNEQINKIRVERADNGYVVYFNHVSHDGGAYAKRLVFSHLTDVFEAMSDAWPANLES